MTYTHLHVHTDYSLFDGTAKIKDLFDRADRLHMPGLAITDHGTMAGVPEFLGGRHIRRSPGFFCSIPFSSCEGSDATKKKY